MEMLVRRGAGGRAMEAAHGRGRLLLASYRTKRSQAKRAAAQGVAPAASDKKDKPAREKKSWGHEDKRRHEDERAAALAQAKEAEHRPTIDEIEQEWSAMRARSTVIPPPVMPARSRKEIENTMRMRRLGLLPEDADGEWDGYAESKDRPEMRAGRPRQHPLNFQHEREQSGRFPSRRPVAAKDKQFTNMVSAPEEVVEREFLIPDEPDHPKALDIAVIGRPNAGKSSIMNGLLDVTVRELLLGWGSLAM